MTAVAFGLLSFYLACIAYGIITVCFYENTSGLIVMSLGVVLYFGGELALTQSWVRRPTRAQIGQSHVSFTRDL